jgi:hypothetical protein
VCYLKKNMISKLKIQISPKNLISNCFLSIISRIIFIKKSTKLTLEKNILKNLKRITYLVCGPTSAAYPGYGPTFYFIIIIFSLKINN